MVNSIKTGPQMRAMAVASLALFALPASAWAQAGPQIRTTTGALRGVKSGEVMSFKGIPYAAPPVGTLRWRPPQPAARWQGVRAADKYGPICEQKYQATDSGVGSLPMSEDCLTLNVFAPADAKRAPVMFWIHGGGYVNGSGTAALYDGAAFAKRGVVVVTINYRLGRFGFFAHPALTATAKGEPLGNYGLMDAIAALQWVRANVARFGGDPRNVTIFGESAGGAAVNHLMLSSAARGLFSRAVVESGLGREPVVSFNEAERAGKSFADAIGARDPSAADLRALSPEAILKAGDPDITAGGGPMIDGRIVAITPLAGFLARREAAVPYIVGWNSLEFPVSASAATGKFFSKPPFTTDNLQTVKSAYPDGASYEQYFLSDALFVEPAVSLARVHAANGNPTFVYQFSVLAKAASSLFKGTPHAMERQYVFGTLLTSPFPTDANDAAQARTIGDYWAAFAASGNPNGGGRIAWPAFSAKPEQILDFTDSGPRLSAPPRSSALTALSRLYPAK